MLNLSRRFKERRNVQRKLIGLIDLAPDGRVSNLDIFSQQEEKRNDAIVLKIFLSLIKPPFTSHMLHDENSINAIIIVVIIIITSKNRFQKLAD